MGSWRVSAEEYVPVNYFLDVADDGYVITGELELAVEEQARLRSLLLAGQWPRAKALSKLDECVDPKCACCRTLNPNARDLFMRALCERVLMVSAEQTSVAYASLGCGLLRFDFEMLEMLLAAGVPVTAVHLVDTSYDVDAAKPAAHRAALAQFTAWFAGRGVEVYAHPNIEKFAFRVRQAQTQPLVVVQVDCWELTGVFDSSVKPMLEEVLQYGGLFCALTSRGNASGESHVSTADAWGEVWRLVPESGRVRQVMMVRYSPGASRGVELAAGEALPPAIGH